MADQVHEHLRTGDGQPVPIAVGELYEDCSYEPMLCVSSELDADELVGISLVNGRVRWCSPTHCGVRKLPLAEAIEIRGTWPPPHVIEWGRDHDIPLHVSCETFQPITCCQVRPDFGQRSVNTSSTVLAIATDRRGKHLANSRPPARRPRWRLELASRSGISLEEVGSVSG